MAEIEIKGDAVAREIAQEHRDRVGGVLKALREIVARFGFVSRTQEHDVAEVFNLSRAEVRGIVSFYHDLKTKPQPPVQVRVCQAEACQSVGARELTRRVETHLGVKLGGATDGVSLDAVYCLGLCAQAPSMMVNGRPLARADLCDLAVEIPA
ncbi:MAG: NADH-quinone oxidoreductase subunit E [Gammaproteobacteria bacterium]|nr:NADH-quinone oxidoreductase subunit E [Gammaproteobacteria bacterium]MYJ74001.1 NADH-quinone oxidoreductase subunit E [Gammaproteobacteria bacterium]